MDPVSHDETPFRTHATISEKPSLVPISEGIAMSFGDNIASNTTDFVADDVHRNEVVLTTTQREQEGRHGTLFSVVKVVDPQLSSTLDILRESSFLHGDSATTRLRSSLEDKDDNRDKSSRGGYVLEVDTIGHSWEWNKRIRIAASFLKDYEEYRPATLYHVADQVTDTQLLVYNIRSTNLWFCLLLLALIFIASISWIETFSKTQSPFSYTWNLICSLVPATFFYIDIAAMVYIKLPPYTKVPQQVEDNCNRIRLRNDIVPRTPSKIWPISLAIYLFALCIENVIEFVKREKYAISWSCWASPIAWFYMFPAARDASEAQIRITLQMIYIFGLKLFLVFIFSVIACQLYGWKQQEDFGNLGSSFISMFALSTTVNNPSVWIDIYAVHKAAAVFFEAFNIFFIFVNIIQLSLVFDKYSSAVKMVRKRLYQDRVESLQLACNALLYFDECHREADEGGCFIPVSAIMRAIQLVRPSYDEAKIKVLSDILCDSTVESLHYTLLTTKIPQVLSSIVEEPFHKVYDTLIYRLFNLSLGVLNLSFILLATIPSSNNSILGDSFLPLGITITMISIGDIFVRGTLSRFCLRGFSRLQLSLFYDVIGLIASVSSAIGIIWMIVDKTDASVDSTPVNLLVISRVVDLIRIFRSIPAFQNVIKRANEVFSVLLGPLILLSLYIHVFVYIGLLLWGGKVIVGQSPSGVPANYDLNNFNSYGSGLVTVLNIMIVNDWPSIAKVFIGVSPRWVVICYFIFANLILVCLLLNVLTAFFVGAFHTISNEAKMDSRMEMQHTGKFITTRRLSYDQLVQESQGSYSDNGEKNEKAYYMSLFFRNYW